MAGLGWGGGPDCRRPAPRNACPPPCVAAACLGSDPARSDNPTGLNKSPCPLGPPTPKFPLPQGRTGSSGPHANCDGESDIRAAGAGVLSQVSETSLKSPSDAILQEHPGPSSNRRLFPPADAQSCRTRSRGSTIMSIKIRDPRSSSLPSQAPMRFDFPPIHPPLADVSTG